MKKNRKFLVAAAIAALSVVGSFGTGYLHQSYKIESVRREYLLDFIHYCQGNEGLRQIDKSKDYSKSSTHDLKELAKFYMEQANFADVSDYWDIKVIESITNDTYARTHARKIKVENDK